MSVGKKCGIFMGIGAVMVVLGAVMVMFWPPIFTLQLKKMMILTNESMSFELWRETPLPMYLELHFFNITNVDAILARTPGIKLEVEELGPYVFKETHIKTNLTWNANSTVTFYNQRWWHFEPEMSVGSLSDEVISVNPIIVTIAHMMRHQRLFVKVPVDLFLRAYHNDIFMKANISSWIFDGIEDPILNIASHFPELPVQIPYDKFGWFYGRNGSIEFDGSFNMNTGATDFSKLGMVERWRYSNRTDFRDECGEVKGSTGELWAPEYGQPEVFVFASDLCSYLTLSKDREVTIEGIEGVQYAANDSTFDNGHRYPHMSCFCSTPAPSFECLPPGALNVSACRLGAPAFVSLPHFLYSDPYYPNKVKGLNATDDMNFRLTLEMFTGMPLAVAAQLQINLLVRHVSGITINNVLPDADTLVPMFWFRQEMQTTPEYADMARVALRVRYWVPYAFGALTVIGLGLLVTGIVVFIKRLLRSPDAAPILSEEESSSPE